MESTVTETNRKIVDSFFTALEKQDFELLKELFAPNARQYNPYAPDGFPKSFDGAEAIYQQYKSLPGIFSKMRFSRQIFASENPDIFFVVFRGEIEMKKGGTYRNDYLGTFILKNGLIIEYTEYFNQVLMARAFDIRLN